MMKTTFSERLNLCLDKEGFPPKHRGRIQLLAEMVGLTHRGASKWVNGESTPPSKKYASLALKLNVNESWLKTGEGSIESVNAVEEPLLFSKKAIDINLLDIDSILSDKKIIIRVIQSNLSDTGNLFAIELDTEAMSPRFPRGSIIIFNDAQAKDGDFVLVNHQDFPRLIFRQLLVIGDMCYLNSHNPKFDRLVLKNKEQIIGKLVQAILEFN